MSTLAADDEVETLRRDRARLSSVLQSSDVGYFDRELPAAKAFHSARMNELAGRPNADAETLVVEWYARAHPDDLKREWPQYAAVLEGRAERFEVEFRLRQGDGSWRWVQARGRGTPNPAGGPPLRISGTFHDVHERKCAELALQASERRFRALTEAAPVGILEGDASGRLCYLNPLAAQLLGIAASDRRGWLSVIHPDDRARVKAEWSAAIAAGHPFTSEHRVQRGPHIAVVRSYAVALHDEAHGFIGSIGAIIDVTEQRALQDQLVVTSRLAALGTLVAGLSHELNNPLAAALADQAVATHDLQFLMHSLRAGEKVAPERLVDGLGEVNDALVDASEAASRIARIVRELGRFAAPKTRPVRVELADLVRRALARLPATLATRAKVELVDAHAPSFEGTEDQLLLLVTNLLSNALQAIPDGRAGRVTVTTSPGTQSVARLEVKDDGVGIEPEVMRRMFDPFFTTREVGAGLGLGLTIAHTIATAHGGTLCATSQRGEGSSFVVEFKRFAAA